MRTFVKFNFGESCVVMTGKRGKLPGSVGEGEAGKKAKATPHAGGKSVSEKFLFSGHAHQQEPLQVRNHAVSKHNTLFVYSRTDGLGIMVLSS